MNADEVKEREVGTDEGFQSLVEIVRRPLPELRRDIETLQPVKERGAVALLRRARENLDWRRLPGLRPNTRPREKLQVRLVKQLALFVLLPTALMAVYLFAFAADQYIAETRFAVRGDVEPIGEAAGEYAALIQKHNSQDGYIVRDFIQSRVMAETAEAELGISKMFANAGLDFWARYRGPQPAEKLARYWSKQVTAHMEAISGVITVNAQAFTPQDALSIAKLIVARSEKLVNDISERAQADMLAHAQTDTKSAEERLKRARLAMQTFRNTWGIIDPIKSAEATLTSIAMLQKDNIKAENDLQVLRDSHLDEKTRGIQVLVATIAATDAQIKRLRNQLTTEGLTAGSPNNITQALLEYEGLKIEQTIAEKLNESMRIALDRARLASQRQQIYLATFVPPMLPDSSLYPVRGYVLVATLFFSFVLWSAIALLISGIKGQRI